MADIYNNLMTNYFFIYDKKSERYIKQNSTPENCEWTRKYPQFMYFSMGDVKDWNNYKIEKS